MHRNFKRHEVAAPHFQRSNLLASLYRRLHRTGVDDARDDTLARAARLHQAHRPLSDQWHRAAVTTVSLGFGDDLAFGKEQPGLEGVKSPLQQLLGLIGALFL